MKFAGASRGGNLYFVCAGNSVLAVMFVQPAVKFLVIFKHPHDVFMKAFTCVCDDRMGMYCKIRKRGANEIFLLLYENIYLQYNIA